MVTQVPAEKQVFLQYLETHFNADPTRFPIIKAEFDNSEHPNIYTAIQKYLEQDGREATIIGLSGGDFTLAYVSLAALVSPQGATVMGGAPITEGPVQYANITIDDENVLTYVQCGLYLIKDGENRLAVLLRGNVEIGISRNIKEYQGISRNINLEVMAETRENAGQFMAEMRQTMRRTNIYRGRILSISEGRFAETIVDFHRLPQIDRQQIILPAGLLDRVERQTIGISIHREKLLSAKRHLKRGLLLYGPPGTGKTFTTMYLASRMKDRTILIITGRGLGYIESSCTMARLLQPSMVTLEDVDLVAEERTRQGGCTTVLLFELLNHMDGFSDDADIIFLLTTNRPDILEPALAARPGRIDMAIEIPLPDFECRKRLFELYGCDMQMEIEDMRRFIERIEGVSGAFIKELMRRAALFATEDGGEMIVRERHLDEALRELLVDGGEMTKALLGVRMDSGVGKGME